MITPTTGRSDTALLKRHIQAKLQPLLRGVAEQSPSARATTAHLRNAVGKPAGSDPAVWEATLGDLPEPLVGKTDEPSAGETAMHVIMALFAIHQQGKTEAMHQPNQGLGTAVQRLVLDSGQDFEKNPFIRRFDALTTSDSQAELAWHLRSLITQLRGAGIGLDYVRLAGQFYEFALPWRRDPIRLQWGRELYAYRPKKESAGDKESETGTTNPPEA
ncbi:type I-E CRISPR-associated protein Cse2/CasB [Corynebacterium heidelbergense]|uniref:Type I-E CRISPR-associated protein Cse2/CasB n=1 Tax=Corynebacterium heidelbergense TaxID=2055947 RepID=A0A364V501_9CORY|nr:type I-E CRISPR-associated protein Cse2/CasB [Corynebacterium heidelbergense]RAV31702.1 type I-E CRISPR-associated protein Cse2/CasB [Corynebacterium heidelbergense]